MPKKAIIIRDFIGGVIPSEDSADEEVNSLSSAGNLNVNREKGRICISGAMEQLKLPTPGTDAMEALMTVDNYKGMRGKGLFHFLSDYPGFQPLRNQAEYDFSSIYIPYGVKSMINSEGESLREGSGSYYIYGCRNNPKVIQDDVQYGFRGQHSAFLNIYQVVNDFTYVDVPNADGNGTTFAIPMGNEGIDGWLSDGADQGYGAAGGSGEYEKMKDWFPVYYFANGGVRVCDGSFNVNNPNILTIQYIDDEPPFSNAVSHGSDGDSVSSVWADSEVDFKFQVNGWTVSRHNLQPRGEYLSTSGRAIEDAHKGLPGPHFFTGIRQYINSTTSSTTPYFGHGDHGFFTADVTNNKPGDGIFYLSLHHSNSIGPILNQGSGLANTSGGIHFTDYPGGNGNVFDVLSDAGSTLLSPGSVAISFGYEIRANGNITMHAGWMLYASWVYKTGEESVPIPLGRNGRMHTLGGVYGQTLALSSSVYNDTNEGDGESLTDVTLFPMVMVNVAQRRTDPRVKGFRIYSTGIGAPATRDKADDREKKLLYEVDWWKGMRIAGSSLWTPWVFREVSDSNPESVIARVYSAGVPQGAPAIYDSLPAETFESFHGYSAEDIVSISYKTAVTANNRVYAGNVIVNPNSENRLGQAVGATTSTKSRSRHYPDSIFKTQIGEYDTFVETPAAILKIDSEDGDQIYHIASWADRLLVFKKNSCYVVNIGQEQEFIEISAKFAGATTPGQVQVTDKGVYWANTEGLYYYDGQSIVNLLETIGSRWNETSFKYTTGGATSTDLTPNMVLKDWHNHISNNPGEEPILSYDPRKKDLIVHNQAGVNNELIIFENDRNFNQITDISETNWERDFVNGSLTFDNTNKCLDRTFPSAAQASGIKIAIDGNIKSLSEGSEYLVQVTVKNTGDVLATTTLQAKIASGASVTMTQVLNPDSTEMPTDGTLTTLQAVITAGADVASGELHISKPASINDPGTIEIYNVSLSTSNKSVDDISFVWNTENNNMMQLFNKTTAPNNGNFIYGGGKSNSIINANGDSVYIANTLFKSFPEWIINTDTPHNGASGEAYFMKWSSDPTAPYHGTTKGEFFETQSIDFGNHSRRKVIQSINITYKSSAATELSVYVTATYLNGDPPQTYYLCTSSASGIGWSDFNGDFEGELPTTGGKLETYTYKHVLANGDDGSAVSLRSKLKNVGSIKVGVAKTNISATVPVDFELEEIAITYREKSNK